MTDHLGATAEEVIESLREDLKNGEEMYIAMRNRAAKSEEIIAKQEARIGSLRAQLAQMRKPVSEKEWKRTSICAEDANATLAEMMTREQVDALIASRSAETVKEGSNGVD